MPNKFNILTPVFNCQDDILNTVFSLVGQTNKNWHWTVCDDLSTDKSIDIIQDIMEKNGLLHKLTIRTRDQKYGETRNTLEEVEQFENNSVVVRLDAGDWLTDLGCLDILDSIYDNHNPAVLWTAHRWSFTDYNISGPIDPNTSVYDQPWKSSHLKTFRCSELKGINHLNFLDNNSDYIMIGCDQAIFLPMMERARLKNKPLIFLPRVMYHYNIDLNDPELFTKPRSLNQKASAENIRDRGFIE
mgnify:CR=1 FL=1